MEAQPLPLSPNACMFLPRRGNPTGPKSPRSPGDGGGVAPSPDRLSVCRNSPSPSLTTRCGRPHQHRKRKRGCSFSGGRRREQGRGGASRTETRRCSGEGGAGSTHFPPLPASRPPRLPGDKPLSPGGPFPSRAEGGEPSGGEAAARARQVLPRLGGAGGRASPSPERAGGERALPLFAQLFGALLGPLLGRGGAVGFQGRGGGPPLRPEGGLRPASVLPPSPPPSRPLPPWKHASPGVTVSRKLTRQPRALRSAASLNRRRRVLPKGSLADSATPPPWPSGSAPTPPRLGRCSKFSG